MTGNKLPIEDCEPLITTESSHDDATGRQDWALPASGSDSHLENNSCCFDVYRKLEERYREKIPPAKKCKQQEHLRSNIIMADSSKDGSVIPKYYLLKFIFFTMFATIGIFASFLPLYLKEIGFSPGQIGTILFFRPVGGFLGGVICPIVVGKFPTQEKAMMFFAGIFLTCSMSMGMVRPMTLSDTCPYDENSGMSISRANETSIGWALTKPSDRSWLFQVDNIALLLTVFSLLVFTGELFFVSVDTVLHGITMARLGKGNSQSFGLIRCWGAVGHGVGSTFAGVVLTWTMNEEKICGRLFEYADYHYIFYIFTGFAFLTFMNAANTFQSSKSEKNTVQMSHSDCLNTLYTVRNIAWLFIVLCRSMFYAVTQGFLYWHMENIGASPALIGLANLVTTTTEFIMFFATPRLIQYFGHSKLVSVGIFSYICRFIIFSFITEPAYILPVEIIEGVMFACVWSSIISYFSNQVSEEGQTQIQGVIQSVFMLGTSLGFLLSGALTQHLGAPAMFLVFAAFAAVALAVFLIAQCVDNDKKEQNS